MAYDDLIQSAAKQFGLDPNLIKAFIKVESNWNPNAQRQEPKINDASYGLMQVLLGTAKSVSGNADITPLQLFDPALNILIGSKYIRSLWDKYGNVDDTIAAYNAGAPYKSSLGIGYVNQGYVNKVKAAYALYGGGLAIGGVLAVLGGLGWYFLVYRRR